MHGGTKLSWIRDKEKFLPSFSTMCRTTILGIASPFWYCNFLLAPRLLSVKSSNLSYFMGVDSFAHKAGGEHHSCPYNTLH